MEQTRDHSRVPSPHNINHWMFPEVQVLVNLHDNNRQTKEWTTIQDDSQIQVSERPVIVLMDWLALCPPIIALFTNSLSINYLPA
jgi:hypothetical protein